MNTIQITSTAVKQQLLFSKGEYFKYVDIDQQLVNKLKDEFPYYKNSIKAITFGQPFDGDKPIVQKFIKGETPSVVYFQVALVKSCNFTCVHCMQNKILNQFQEIDVDAESVVKRAKLCNTVMKRHQQSYHTPIILDLMGGEVTLLSCSLLKDVIEILIEGLDISKFNLTTNLYRPYDYLYEVTNVTTGRNIPTSVYASFHDSIITTPKARQKFFAKLTHLGLYADVSSSLTFSKDNQRSIFGLAINSITGNRVVKNTFVPLFIHGYAFDLKPGPIASYPTVTYDNNLEPNGYEWFIEEGVNSHKVINSEKYVCFQGQMSYIMFAFDDFFELRGSGCSLNGHYLHEHYGVTARCQLDVHGDNDFSKVDEMFKFSVEPKICKDTCKSYSCAHCSSATLIEQPVADKYHVKYKVYS